MTRPLMTRPVMNRHVLFLPGAGEDGFRWLRIGEGGIDARGEGVPPECRTSAATGKAGEDTGTVVVVPAEDVTLHWATLPDRSAVQSSAAARLLVAEASATPLTDLHVAVGREDGGEERPIGVVSSTRMREWLAMLAEQGVDPDAMVPAPMLLPRPDSGYIRADLGTASVVRGPTTGFAHDPVLTDLVTAGEPPTVLGREDVEAAIIAAAARPTLNLRQGIFARRRQLAVDWAQVRRLGWLAAAILLVTLLITLVEITKLSFAADELERRTEAMARQGLPRGETVNDATSQLDARLVRLRGVGMGFSATAAAVFNAVRAVPGSEVRSLSFDAKGQLQAMLVTQTQGQIVDVVKQIEGQGFKVLPSTFDNDGQRLSGRVTVAPK